MLEDSKRAHGSGRLGPSPLFFFCLSSSSGEKKKKKHKELIRLPPTATLPLSLSHFFFFAPVSHVFTPVAASLGHWDRSVFFFFSSPFSFSRSQLMSCLLGIKLHPCSSQTGPSCFFSPFLPHPCSKSFRDLQV